MIKPTSPTNSSTAAPRLMRRSSVEFSTGLSRSGIYELMAKNEFPKPINLNGARCVAWIESEVNDWINKRIAESGRAA